MTYFSLLNADGIIMIVGGEWSNKAEGNKDRNSSRVLS